MKNHTLRFLALICAIVLSASVFSGCGDLLGSKSTRNYVTAQETALYELPDFTSAIVTTCPAGTTLMYTETRNVDGIVWARVEKGWFILDAGNLSIATTAAPTEPTLMGDALYTPEHAIVKEEVAVFDTPNGNQLGTTLAVGDPVSVSRVATKGSEWSYIGNGWVPESCLFFPDEPGYDAVVCYTTTSTHLFEGASESTASLETLSVGARVEYSSSILIGDVRWGYTGSGWVCTDDLYESGRSTGERIECTVRYTTSVLEGPGNQYSRIGTAEVGEQIDVFIKLPINGTSWGCTHAGWVCMDDIYEEGTVGNRPCSGYVTKTTSLNVRSGPSMDHNVIDKLPARSYIEILERVTRNGKDWGFNGTGWVFMELVDLE